MPRKEVLADGVEIWLGDCRDVLPLIGRVDAVVADPPYGVNFDGKGGHYRSEPSAKRKDTYQSYNDSVENFERIIIPAITQALTLSNAGLVFMSSQNLQALPPGEVGGIYLPNGCGRGCWGFQSFMHCVFYGQDPYLRAGLGCFPNGKYGLYGNDANTIPHPCAKPIKAMEWAVNRASLPNCLVLDPFMGSGTTGVACVKLGRKFIGIEIEPAYFAIARRRISEALMQPDLFFQLPSIARRDFAPQLPFIPTVKAVAGDQGEA